MFTQLRRSFSILVLLLSGMALTWASLPSRQVTQVSLIKPSSMSLPTSGKAAAAAILDSHQVVLEWPSAMRIGDNAWIKMIFQPAADEGETAEPTTGYTDAYDHYSVMAEARFEVAGVRVDPANPTRESLPPGQGIDFSWKISSDEGGTYAGTAWLYIRFVPLDGTPAVQVPVYAQEIRLHTTGLFGLSGAKVRLIGSAGILICLVVLINDIIRVRRRMPSNA